MLKKKVEKKIVGMAITGTTETNAQNEGRKKINHYLLLWFKPNCPILTLASMPAHGERDKADPGLIVEVACIPQPSKC